MRAATVRDATVDDADAIARVHVDSWRGAYRGLVPDEVLDGLSVERRTEGWRDWLSGRRTDDAELGCVLVSELDGRIVGFVNAGPSRDEDATDEPGEVRAIYVLPEAWDRGVGAALMNEAISRLRRSFTAATLWVLEGNARGRRFYERGGWRHDGSVQKLNFAGTDLDEIRYRIDFGRS